MVGMASAIRLSNVRKAIQDEIGCSTFASQKKVVPLQNMFARLVRMYEPDADDARIAAILLESD